MFVEFNNGSILSIHGSDNPDSLRGIDCRGAVLDEWAFIDHRIWDEILRPIIAQSVDRWAMFILTPNGRGHAYEQWIKQKDNPEWGRYLLTASQSQIIPQTELDKIKAEIPARVYAQEFDCVFGDDTSGVFKGVDQCIFGAYEPFKQGRTYVTGVDLAKHNDYSVIMTLCRETRQFVSFQRFNHLEWSIQKERIIDEVLKYKSMCVVDATGVGDPIAEDLGRAGINVKPFKITNANKKELIDRLAVTIEQRLITFPNNETLVEELKSYAYDVTDSGRITFGAPNGMHDDTVISMALAVWGSRTFLYGKKLQEDRRERVTRVRFNRNERPANAGFGF
jgi:phage FluMu gp28-like protein